MKNNSENPQSNFTYDPLADPPRTPPPPFVRFNDKGAATSLCEQGLRETLRSYSDLSCINGRWFYFCKRSVMWGEISKPAAAKELYEECKALLVESRCEPLQSRLTSNLMNNLVSCRAADTELRAIPKPPSELVRFRDRTFDLGSGCSELPLREHYWQACFPFDYNSNAECPEFGAWLERAVGVDQLEVLQRFAGLMLIGENLPQRILYMYGEGKAGKGTFTAILRNLAGKTNCTELRTSQLKERFETSRYAGKTLLIGSDVDRDFLTHEGGAMLKKMTGGDAVSGESKGQNMSVELEGGWNIAITSNVRLRVRLDGDVSAWRRRLVPVEFTPQHINPNGHRSDYAQFMWNNEGPGIVNWAIVGACAVLGDESFPLPDETQERIDSILCESDSARLFVTENVVRSEGQSVTVGELKRAYVSFLEDRNWRRASGSVEAQLMQAMADVHGIGQSKSVLRDEVNVRGYRGVAIHV